jgi:hypothetical protein
MKMRSVGDPCVAGAWGKLPLSLCPLGGPANITCTGGGEADCLSSINIHIHIQTHISTVCARVHTVPKL